MLELFTTGVAAFGACHAGRTMETATIRPCRGQDHVPLGPAIGSELPEQLIVEHDVEEGTVHVHAAVIL